MEVLRSLDANRYNASKASTSAFTLEDDDDDILDIGRPPVVTLSGSSADPQSSGGCVLVEVPMQTHEELVKSTQELQQVAREARRRREEYERVQHDSTDSMLSKSDETALQVDEKIPVYAPGEAPDFPDDLRAILREVDACPLCVAFGWRELTIDEQGCVVPVVKKRQRRAPNKAVVGAKKLASVNGPARMKHLRLCALQKQLPVDVVITVVKHEQVRNDQKRRAAHIEAQSKASMWKSLVGESPPGTQIQENVERQRKGRVSEYYIARSIADGMHFQRRGTRVPIIKRNGKICSQQKGKFKIPPAAGGVGAKKKSTAPRVRTGVHGGIDRSTTTVQAPKRIFHAIKHDCITMFGRPSAKQEPVQGQSAEDRVLMQYDLSEQAVDVPFLSARRRRGLGIGACCAPEDAHDPRKSFTADARLRMGCMMALAMETAAKKRVL